MGMSQAEKLKSQLKFGDAEAKFLVVCEWLMNELGAGFEWDRYELFGVFLVTCEQARHEFWGHIFSHVRPFYEQAASDLDP